MRRRPVIRKAVKTAVIVKTAQRLGRRAAELPEQTLIIWSSGAGADARARRPHRPVHA